MGVVYEVFDRERRQAVALKSLLNFTPAALFALKQEFRTLADVHHRNLVRLYELIVADKGDVFFTMELVNGADLLTYVQKPGSHRDPRSEARVLNTIPTRGVALGVGATDSPHSSPPRPRPSPADFDRLRRTLRQLVEGVMAVHRAGKLHRDIKPSNILVADDGRVVILDFGVATELSRARDANFGEAEDVVGTVRYMSPEQAMAEALTPASDWHSVGGVLYEALVGRAPFVGPAMDVLTMKTTLDPTSPAECVEGVPPEPLKDDRRTEFGPLQRSTRGRRYASCQSARPGTDRPRTANAQARFAWWTPGSPDSGSCWCSARPEPR